MTSYHHEVEVNETDETESLMMSLVADREDRNFVR